jgi:hypothetical protein
MDDSVEQPNGVMVSTKDAMTGEEFKYVGSPWERSIEKFDFGCSSKFTGKIGLVSATGHKIELNDTESDPQIRGEENYIRIISACGNKIELNDHSLNSEEKCVSGAQRGIHLQSTSNHTIDMVDEDNEQCSPPRKEGGTPIPTAKKGYVRIRSGYGLEIKLNDENSQEDTVSQSIQLYAPQKDNEKRGPHIFRMQEKPEGAGQVYLQVGGDYVCYTYDSHNIYVGDKEKNPADMLTYVSRDKYDITEEKYLNSADQHIFLSKKFIFLMAGEDCKPEDATITDGAPKKGPCVWPVLCLSNKGIVISDRIFASASEDATLASIFMLEPFTNASQEQEQPTT